MAQLLGGGNEPGVVGGPVSQGGRCHALSLAIGAGQPWFCSFQFLCLFTGLHVGLLQPAPILVHLQQRHLAPQELLQLTPFCLA